MNKADQQSQEIIEAIDDAYLEGSEAREADEIRKRAEEKVDRMGQGSTFKLLLEFSIPAVVGVVVQMLYNVIDAVYVGHAVGADGLAATTVANPLMTAMTALAMLIGVGGNALMAIRLGEGKREEARRVLGASFILLMLVSVVVWIVGATLLSPVLVLSGAEGEVLPLARSFTTILIAGCPFQFIAFGMNNFIRTAGYPNRALGSMLIGTAANVVFGYLFIVVLDAQMAGAGLATVCSWILSSIFVMQFFLKKKSPMPLRKETLHLRAPLAGRICVMGIAPAIMELGFAVSSALENNLLVTYGAADPVGIDGALAIMRVLSAVGMFTFMPMVGIASGAQPIIGYNYGAKKFDRMKRVVWQAMLLAAAITVPIWLSVLLAPDMYANLFSLPMQYRKEAAWALVLFLIFVPILSIQSIGSNYFNATGQAFKATILTLTRQILFLIPLLIFCPQILPLFTPLSPLESVWFAASISDITSVLIVSVFLVMELRRLRRISAAA